MVNLKNLINLISLTTNHLMETLDQIYKDEDKVTDGENYLLIVRDDTAPTLVAHIDTYFDQYSIYEERWENRNIEEENGILRCYDDEIGLGADDRAGVYTLVELSQKYKNINLLFTNYEEIGCIGVKKFIEDYPEILRDSKCFIQYDRKGETEYVAYQENEKEFEDIFKEFYSKEKGYSSDVKYLSKHYGIASVNICTGYYENHSSQEYLVIKVIERNIEIFPFMLSRLNRQFFVI